MTVRGAVMRHIKHHLSKVRQGIVLVGHAMVVSRREAWPCALYGHLWIPDRTDHQCMICRTLIEDMDERPHGLPLPETISDPDI